MTTPQRPAKTIPPPPNKPKPTFSTETGTTRDGFSIGIYGPEGIGKSSLASLCPGAVFADIEGSMEDIDVAKVKELRNQGDWTLLRAWVQSLGRGIYGIDSMTKAEDWAASHVIKTKKANDGGKATDSLEDFKYKAGLTFVCDEFKRLLGDISAARRRGASFIMVAHSRIQRFKNPDGSDFVRHEPRLVDDPKASNMLQWVQFCDHVAFINLDINAEKGKASGSGSRSIYLDSSPTRISKCRGIDSSMIDYGIGDTTLWSRLGLC
jgi:hypothetical protein